MMPKTLFRKTRQKDQAAAAPHAPSPSGVEPQAEQTIRIYDGQIEHLKKQKDLHALALKEMYQFMCKLESNYREENQKLQEQLREQQLRSARLIEVTTGLWEIVEMLEGYQETSSQVKNLTNNVKELTKLETQGDGASTAQEPTLEFDQITNLMDAVENVEASA